MLSLRKVVSNLGLLPSNEDSASYDDLQLGQSTYNVAVTIILLFFIAL
jgi:hypothetical protein